jgi:ferredoxin-thioredoxin reductase catalytic subunit
MWGWWHPIFLLSVCFLDGIMSKSLWRCHVCNDIHLGISGPKVCPSCGAEDAFVRTDDREALRIMGEGKDLDNSEVVIDSWREFAEGNDTIQLNPDHEAVATLAEGVLENMRNHGLRYCPCRITTGNAENDLRLICPCNFPSQKTWEEEGECWCGLFLRK